MARSKMRKRMYGVSDINRARELVGEGKASSVPRAYARGGAY